MGKSSAQTTERMKGTGIMQLKRLRNLLERVHRGRLEVDAALDPLKRLPFEDLGYAKIDNHRCLR